MKRTLPFLLSFGLLTMSSMAQQVLFSEGFDGDQHAFTLNTTDVGSTANGANLWLVNDAYVGGTGTITCLGSSIPFSVANTAAQPVGISNANGKYMHMASAGGVASGVLNCHFAAADGFCTPAQNFFARMGTDISTVGASNVTLKFWWLCAGSNNNYGEVYYSTDGGQSWTQITEPLQKYKGQSTWTQQTISLAAFAGQNTLRFGFRFVNGSSFNASDPGFAVDDVVVTAATQDPNAILTGTIQPTTHCPGGTVMVPYTASGAWGPSNTFIAQLSDATGDFSQAVDIGSVNSTFSGTITAVIPANTPLGTGYLVRVRGTDPAMMGTVSLSALTIVAGPYAGQDTHVSFCENSGPQVLLDYLPGADECGAWTLNGEAVPGILDPATAESGAYVYTTNCPGDCPQDQATLTVGIVPAPDAGTDGQATVCVYDPDFQLFGLLGGTPDVGGSWSFQGAPFSGMFNPATDESGCYQYVVPGIPPCVADTATVCVQVDQCTGIAEQEAGTGMRWLGRSGTEHVVAVGRLRPGSTEVLDVTGRLVQAKIRQEGDRLYLSMEGAPSGVYFLRAMSGERPVVVRLVHGR
ncbi:MAG TPA: hypothetical protein PKD45_13010 [Flavobacteriales bacterium]|nr:hypothetical protein [Flavobacteriales bacterium]